MVDCCVLWSSSASSNLSGRGLPYVSLSGITRKSAMRHISEFRMFSLMIFCEWSLITFRETTSGATFRVTAEQKSAASEPSCLADWRTECSSDRRFKLSFSNYVYLFVRERCKDGSNSRHCDACSQGDTSYSRRVDLVYVHTQNGKTDLDAHFSGRCQNKLSNASDCEGKISNNCWTGTPTGPWKLVWQKETTWDPDFPTLPVVTESMYKKLRHRPLTLITCSLPVAMWTLTVGIEEEKRTTNNARQVTDKVQSSSAETSHKQVD